MKIEILDTTGNWNEQLDADWTESIKKGEVYSSTEDCSIYVVDEGEYIIRVTK